MVTLTIFMTSQFQFYKFALNVSFSMEKGFLELFSLAISMR